MLPEIENTDSGESTGVHSPANNLLPHTRPTPGKGQTTTYPAPFHYLVKSQIRKYCLCSFLLWGKKKKSPKLVAKNNSYLFLACDFVGQQFGLGSAGQVSSASQAALPLGGSWLLGGTVRPHGCTSLLTQQASLGLLAPRRRSFRKQQGHKQPYRGTFQASTCVPRQHAPWPKQFHEAC